MGAAPILNDEAGRLAAVDRIGVLDTPQEPLFDGLVALAKHVLDVPICAIGIIGRDRLWFKAKSGFEAAEVSRAGAFCDKTIRQTHVLMVENALEDPEFADYPMVKGEAGVRSYLGAPLTLPDGFRIGTICVFDTRPRRFTEEEITTLTHLGEVVVEALEQRLAANTDSLTKLMTRSAWRAAVGEEIRRVRRYGGDMAVALCDLDHFKQVNDRFGHPAGDAVLRAFAERMKATVRATDLVARVGGEEFGILMPNTDLKNARSMAERIREATEAMTIPLPDEARVSITVSIGCADLCSADTDVKDIYDRADQALYRAKDAGRNRVATADVAETLRVV